MEGRCEQGRIVAETQRHTNEILSNMDEWMGEGCTVKKQYGNDRRPHG